MIELLAQDSFQLHDRTGCVWDRLVHPAQSHLCSQHEMKPFVDFPLSCTANIILSQPIGFQQQSLQVDAVADGVCRLLKTRPLSRKGFM